MTMKGGLIALTLLTCSIMSSVALPPIHVDLIPLSNNNRPGTHLSGTRYITVHNTANTSPGADAKAHASYVKNPSTDVSWHYTVDDHEIYQHLPTNEVGWHAGTSGGNSQSVGIEICENSDGNFERAVANAQQLIAKLMHDLNVPLSRVVQHKFWSGKECPRKLINRWDSFLQGIGSYTPEGCYGTVEASGGLNIRAQPNTSSPLVGSFYDGENISIQGRVSGTPVNGNPYWFKVSNGYVTTEYVRIVSGSPDWCYSH